MFLKKKKKQNIEWLRSAEQTRTQRAGSKTILFLFCCDFSKPQTHLKQHRNACSKTHAHTRLYLNHTITSEKGIKGTGQTRWKDLGPSRGPNANSLTRITGIPHRKLFHTTGPQCFLQKNRK